MKKSNALLLYIVIFVVCGVFIVASGMILIPLLLGRDLWVLNSSGFIDKSGKFAFHRLNTHARRPFSDGYWFEYDQFYDKSGKAIGKKEFRYAEDFSEGLAAVSEGSMWGFLNTSGEYAIQPKFEDAGSFKEGLAPVKYNNAWGFIDKTGKWVITPKFEKAIPFSEGLAAVSIKKKAGFIDHTGRIVIEPIYDIVVSFSEGMAYVIFGKETYDSTKERRLCIDKAGKVIVNVTEVLRKLEKTTGYPSSPTPYPHNYQNALFADVDDLGKHEYAGGEETEPMRLSEGLMLIESDGKHGYINKAGQVVVPCRFRYAFPFSEGLACVAIDDKHKAAGGGQAEQSFGFIDKTGKFVIPAKYDWAFSFSEGLAGVRDRFGGGGFVDHSGNIVLPIRGGWASYFNDGLAGVGEPVEYP